MKYQTTMIVIGGTCYLRVPPAFAGHLGLGKPEKGKNINAMIQDETNKKGQHFCSFWKK